MEYVNPEENWKKIIEKFIKKSVLVILNNRIKPANKSISDPINSEVINKNNEI
jgi:hypothetical protein